MATKINKYSNGVHAVTHVIHEPGNGTRYEAVGVKMPAEFPEHGGFWLIAFPLIGASYFFKEAGFLAVSYVSEKLAYQRNGVKVCEVDLHEMTKIISLIIGRKNDAATDSKGYLPVLRIAQ
jgi:hypothetical protein